MKFAKGKITRLYADGAGLYCKVVNEIGPRSKDDYYRLDLAHQNYDSIFSLLLSAPGSGQKVNIRISKVKTKDKRPEIAYVTIDY